MQTERTVWGCGHSWAEECLDRYFWIGIAKIFVELLLGGGSQEYSSIFINGNGMFGSYAVVTRVELVGRTIIENTASVHVLSTLPDIGKHSSAN